MTKASEDRQIKLDWLRLYRSEGIGSVTFKQLLSRFQTASKALEHIPELSLKNRKSGTKSALTICSRQDAERELDALEKFGGTLLLSCEDAYPSLLKNTEDYPPLLSVLGNVSLLKKKSVAIVGSRNASLNGNKLAEKFARDLGTHGYVVTSGLARGIDASAHKGALTTGTIAVVAGGVDNIYPKENAELYKSIKENGLILAENHFGMTPRAIDFPRRNRIVAGLSQATLVIEAALRSGSLITARLASEQGRDVFAVPGSPLDPRSSGCNDLIRNGATLAENAQQIIDDLKFFEPKAKQQQDFSFSEEDEINFEVETFAGNFTVHLFDEEVSESVSQDLHEEILKQLTTTPLSVDEIIRQMKISSSDCLSAILDLELGGQVTRHSGNKISKTYG